MRVVDNWKKYTYCMTVVNMIRDKGITNFKGIYDKKALYTTGDMFMSVKGKNDYEICLCLDSERCIRLAEFREYVNEGKECGKGSE